MKVALMMKWDLKHPTVSDLEMVAELWEESRILLTCHQDAGNYIIG